MSEIEDGVWSGDFCNEDGIPYDMLGEKGDMIE